MGAIGVALNHAIRSAIRSASKPVCSMSTSTKSIPVDSRILAIPRVPNSQIMWPTGILPSSTTWRKRLGRMELFVVSPAALPVTSQLFLEPRAVHHLAIDDASGQLAASDSQHVPAGFDAIVAHDLDRPRQRVRGQDHVV